MTTRTTKRVSAKILLRKIPTIIFPYVVTLGLGVSLMFQIVV